MPSARVFSGRKLIIGGIYTALKQILITFNFPAWWDATLNRLRGTVIIESGTVTTVNTVTTVTGLTNIDLLQGKLLVLDNEILSWANNCRALIT